MTGPSLAALRVFRFLRQFARSDCAAVAPLTAMMLVPILGAMALSIDAGYWYKTQRSMQSAADSAALAAAFVDGTTCSTDCDGAAKGTTARLGFTNGTGDVTVVTERNGSTYCPTGVTGTCTRVTIGNQASFWFGSIVGFLGNANGKQGMTAVAVARQSGSGGPSSLCITALAGSGATPALQGNGVPFANMAGCSVFSNTSLNCNGNDLGADYGIAVGTATGCGKQQVTGATPITDPYSGLAASIPTGTCQSSNNISGSKNWTGTIKFCGDVNVTGDVTLQSGSNAVIVIDNGTLNLNKNTFKTASGASATLIFTGTNASTSKHYPTAANGGNPGATLDFAAPTSGTWKGIAIYQNPALTNNVSFTYAGSAPKWNVTGVVYLPHATFTLSGAVGTSTNGYNCFALVVDNITINGTGNMFANPQSQCASAGVTPPSSTIPGGGNPWLIQ